MGEKNLYFVLECLFVFLLTNKGLKLALALTATEINFSICSLSLFDSMRVCFMCTSQSSPCWYRHCHFCVISPYWLCCSRQSAVSVPGRGLCNSVCDLMG